MLALRELELRLGGASLPAQLSGRQGRPARLSADTAIRRHRYPPTLSRTHLPVKLDLAAPESFFSAADTSHALLASD